MPPITGQIGLLVGVLLATLVLAACSVGSDDGSEVPAEPIFITASPADAMVVAGSDAAFRVVASGDGLSFRWQSRSESASTWTDVPGANSASLRVALATLQMSGQQFRVVVSDRTAGEVVSPAVRLAVSPTCQPATVVIQPADAAVNQGEDAAFHATVDGTSPSYQWQTSSDRGATWTDIAGANAPTVVLARVAAADDARRLRVAVSNTCVTRLTSGEATLSVKGGEGDPPSISIAPQAVSVVAPQAATFRVKASGKQPLKYSWYRSKAGSEERIDGATAATYTTPPTTLADDGTLFKVVVADSAGKLVEARAPLQVAAAASPPAIETGLALQRVPTATSVAVFEALRVGGTPTPVLQWQVSTDGGARFINVNGATSQTYRPPRAALADNGKLFRLVASNDVGSVSSPTALLTVVDPEPPVCGSAYVRAPQVKLVGEIATVVYPCSGWPLPTYHWQLSVDNGASFVDIPTPEGAANDGWYSTPPTTLADNGKLVRALVSNMAGSSTSAAVPLKVVAVEPLPVFTSGPVPAVVNGPGTAAFTVELDNARPFTLQWQVSTDLGATFTDIQGATSLTYTTPPTTGLDHLKYFRAVATNSAGSTVSQAAYLIEYGVGLPPSYSPPPGKAWMPWSVMVTEPETARFTAQIGGASLGTIRWEVSTDDGATFQAIPGTESTGYPSSYPSYTTPPTTVADNGKLFRVSVSNWAGASVSPAARLFVAPSNPTAWLPAGAELVASGGARSLSEDLGGSTASMTSGWILVTRSRQQTKTLTLEAPAGLEWTAAFAEVSLTPSGWTLTRAGGGYVWRPDGRLDQQLSSRLRMTPYWRIDGDWLSVRDVAGAEIWMKSLKDQRELKVLVPQVPNAVHIMVSWYVVPMASGEARVYFGVQSNEPECPYTGTYYSGGWQHLFAAETHSIGHPRLLNQFCSPVVMPWNYLGREIWAADLDRVVLREKRRDAYSDMGGSGLEGQPGADYWYVVNVAPPNTARGLGYTWGQAVYLQDGLLVWVTTDGAMRTYPHYVLAEFNNLWVDDFRDSRHVATSVHLHPSPVVGGGGLTFIVDGQLWVWTSAAGSRRVMPYSRNIVQRAITPGWLWLMIGLGNGQYATYRVAI